MKSYKFKRFLKKILFLILLFVLSPILIPVVILCTIFFLLYLPFDRLIYNKYQELGKYYLFITLIKKDEIKKIKLAKRHHDNMI